MTNDENWTQMAINAIVDSEYYAAHIPDEYWNSVPLPGIENEQAFVFMDFGPTRAIASGRAPASRACRGRASYPERRTDWIEFRPGDLFPDDSDLRVFEDPEVLARSKKLLPIRATLLSRHRELCDVLFKSGWLIKAPPSEDTKRMATEWAALLDQVLEPQLLWLYRVSAKPLRDWIHQQQNAQRAAS